MTDLRQRVFVAFDTETTGLEPRDGHVVEIAGVRFTGDGREIGRFATLANPGRPINADVTRIHGIDDTMVAYAPDSTEACRQFTAWIDEEDLLVAHNAPFDVAFISSELTRGRIESPRNDVIDTLLCMRSLDLPVPSYRLGTLVEHFGFESNGYHRALQDALHVRDLLLEFLNRNPGMSLGMLLGVGGVETHYKTAPSTMRLMPRFASLHEAIDRGELLSMRYDGDDELGFGAHRILPLTLTASDGKEFLVAQCMHDGGVREFRLDRIIEFHEVR